MGIRLPAVTPAIATLIAGLGLGVIATFFGIERQREGVIHRPPAAFNLPALASALVAFGVCGYVLMQFSSLRTIWSVVIAAGAAALAWTGSGVALARWALRAPTDDPHEAAKQLQGYVAVVAEPITGTGRGTIVFILNDQTQRMPARSIDGRSIAGEMEVVIQQVEDAVAYVEPWSAVEKRL